jgi:2-oxo-4-hydroxy-4-carboxy-5-ureidoimidazoline decarboxylase
VSGIDFDGASAATIAAAVRAGDLSDVEYDRFQRLNAACRERFAFPFIIAMRRHDKTSLLAAFEARLGNGRDTEIEKALTEIFIITRLRLDALFGAP